MSDKIGILGGTFDPVHNGHLQLAKAALIEFDLDKVLFIPSAFPPHKGDVIANFSQRVAMLELVCENKTQLEVSTIERDLPKPSYTIDTINALRGDCSGGESFFFIIGSDAFLEIPTWKGYEIVLTKTNFILARRAGYKLPDLTRLFVKLRYDYNGFNWVGRTHHKKIYTLTTNLPEVSSSSVRQQLAAAVDSREYCTSVKIDPRVLKYIGENKLYV